MTACWNPKTYIGLKTIQHKHTKAFHDSYLITYDAETETTERFEVLHAERSLVRGNATTIIECSQDAPTSPYEGKIRSLFLGMKLMKSQALEGFVIEGEKTSSVRINAQFNGTPLYFIVVPIEATHPQSKDEQPCSEFHILWSEDQNLHTTLSQQLLAQIINHQRGKNTTLPLVRK